MHRNAKHESVNTNPGCERQQSNYEQNVRSNEMRTQAYRQKRAEVNTLQLEEDLLASNPNKTPEQSN